MPNFPFAFKELQGRFITNIAQLKIIINQHQIIDQPFFHGNLLDTRIYWGWEKKFLHVSSFTLYILEETQQVLRKAEFL